MIRTNGKTYSLIYWRGRRHTKAYYNGRLVMLTPDRNTYLMAAPKVYLRAGEKEFLSFKNLAFYSATENYDIADGEFCFSFRLAPDAAAAESQIWLCGVAGCFAFRLNKLRARMELVLNPNKTVYFVPMKILTAGSNLIEFARQGKSLCLFVNHTCFRLPNRTLSGGSGVNVWCPERNILTDISYIPEAKVSAGSKFPDRQIITIGNLIPTDITRANMHGFEIEDTLRETDPLNALNPNINTSYPRWQAHATAPGPEMLITLPEGKNGAVLKYSVTQWYDSGYPERSCNKWQLSGSKDKQNWDVIDLQENPWQTTDRGETVMCYPHNLTNYKYLKLHMMSAGNASYFSLGQIRFWTQDPQGSEEVEIIY